MQQVSLQLWQRDAPGAVRSTINDLAKNDTILAVSLATFFMSLGENLWKQFLPKYLEALGAPVAFIGLFGTTEDVLDGVYQYPGGWIGDRAGRRNALVLFVSMSTLGYATYWSAPTWPWLFVGLLFAMAWSSLASPTLFAIIGDVLPPHRRAMGFSVQSITKRVPITVAPLAGSCLIARGGLSAGIRASLLLSMALAAVTAIACTRVSAETAHEAGHTPIPGVWKSLPGELRSLLLSDVFIRTCEGMVEVLLVLYATNVIGITLPQFGVLVAVQMVAALVTYMPVGHLADQLGRKPFVVATFTFFALFPIAVALSRGFVSLIGAFVVGGLREIGEPARKAMIVDMVQPALRARSIGLYYLVRSLTISPAAFVGGLWHIAPVVPFATAGGIGLLGTVVFTLTVNERGAR